MNTKRDKTKYSLPIKQRKIIRKVFQNLFSRVEACRTKENIPKDSNSFYIFQILKKKEKNNRV
jgi:hypothetical protein